jgi:hypothetical protein
MADELLLRYGARLSYRVLDGEEGGHGHGPTVELVSDIDYDEGFLALAGDGWLGLAEDGSWEFGYSNATPEFEDMNLGHDIPRAARAALQHLSNAIWTHDLRPGGVLLDMQAALAQRGINLGVVNDPAVALLEGSHRDTSLSVYAHGGVDLGPWRNEDHPDPRWRGTWFVRARYTPEDPPPGPQPERTPEGRLRLRASPWEREPHVERTFVGTIEGVANQVADFFYRMSAAMSGGAP